ncbi:MAG: hypothetical protein ACYCQI_14280 [Gammaproteobacteria bacterium]
MFKFLHLICGTTFFGIMIAAFFYIARSIRKGDRSLINYSLKASYFGDGIIFFIVLIQFITAIKLVSVGHLTLAIPWIFIAYHAFGTIVLLWLSILLIKLLLLSKTDISPIALKVYYLLNVMMILIFIIIIHDAVTQSTWFDFLFRK